MENASQTAPTEHFVPNCGPSEIFPEEAKRLAERSKRRLRRVLKRRARRAWRLESWS